MVPPDRFRDVEEAPDSVVDDVEAHRQLHGLWQLLDTLHDSGLVHGQRSPPTSGGC